jgi:hypothetical protein
MGGWIQSGNYTPKKYGAEKARTPAVKASTLKTADQVEVLKGVIGTLKDGPRKAARQRQLNVRGKKK